MIWFLAQLAFLSFLFGVGGWVGSADRPWFPRLMVALICAALWPILAPLMVYLRMAEARDRRRAEAEDEGGGAPNLRECAACKWSEFDPKDCQSCHGCGDTGVASTH